MAVFELIKGLAVTAKHILKPKVTTQYPEQKKPTAPRFPTNTSPFSFGTMSQVRRARSAKEPTRRERHASGYLFVDRNLCALRSVSMRGDSGAHAGSKPSLTRCFGRVSLSRRGTASVRILPRSSQLAPDRSSLSPGPPAWCKRSSSTIINP